MFISSDELNLAKPSRNSLRGSIVTVRQGLAIYQTHASPYWFARVWDPRAKKNVVRSTKETSKVKARHAAEDIAYDLRREELSVLPEYTFKYFASRFLTKSAGQVARGERNQNYIRTAALCLDNAQWGLLSAFEQRDVRELQTRDYNAFKDDLLVKRPDLAPSTLNMLTATFRNVLKVAQEDGTIAAIPATPRRRQKDNPRAFFYFHPLVTTQEDEYKKLLATAKTLAAQKEEVRGTLITHELYDLILFCVHSFVRPMTTELYALRRRDITIAKNPNRLLVTVRNGKTGRRVANTTEGAVAPYRRAIRRYPDASRDEYLFLPQYPNRATASRIISRQFNHVLEVAGLKQDPTSGQARTLYSLRHTAICMRIVLSHGKVNIYNLAKNAGTSVEQIERFYARNLPLGPELAINLQSFGNG